MEIEKDYYHILNVSPTATTKEIQLAFRTLARQYHATSNPEPEAAHKLREIQEAYETLSDAAKKKKYDHRRGKQNNNRSSVLSLQTVTSHKTLSRLSNEQAYYALVSIIPMADAVTARLPLNICLVLDRSNSMKGQRLQQVKEAIHHIIGKLQPEDALGLVTFNDRAQVLLQSQRRIDPARAKAVVSTIQAGGGTEILQGLRAGIEEIKRNQSELSVNHIILLTDGQTYGDEKACLEEAKWAGSHQIHLSTIGIGADWNEDLLDQMAVLSGGGSVYIDKPEKVQNIFNETMENLETVVARELTLMINPRVEVRLQEAYQVTPHICRLEVHDHKIMLGPLSSTLEKSVLMEFRIRELPPGEQQLLRITVEADVPGRAKGHSWDWSELMVDVSEQKALNPNIPQLILGALSNLSVYKMQEKVASDLKGGQIQRATQRLQIMATQLFNMGEPELAQIASLEADQLTRTSMLSPEGSKKIRYGTRVLNSKDTTMLTTRLAQLTQNLQLEPRERSSS